MRTPKIKKKTILLYQETWNWGATCKSISYKMCTWRFVAYESGLANADLFSTRRGVLSWGGGCRTVVYRSLDTGHAERQREREMTSADWQQWCTARSLTFAMQLLATPATPHRTSAHCQQRHTAAAAAAAITQRSSVLKNAMQWWHGERNRTGSCMGTA